MAFPVEFPGEPKVPSGLPHQNSFLYGKSSRGSTHDSVQPLQIRELYSSTEGMAIFFPLHSLPVLLCVGPSISSHCHSVSPSCTMNVIQHARTRCSRIVPEYHFRNTQNAERRNSISERLRTLWLNFCSQRPKLVPACFESHISCKSSCILSVSRSLMGWIGDKAWMNRLVLFGVAAMLAGACTCLSAFLTAFWMLAVYSCVFGVLAGEASWNQKQCYGNCSAKSTPSFSPAHLP